MNLEELLTPVAPDTPCGEDLEYGAVDELTRAAQTVPEQQIGDTVVPAQEPEWDAVRRQALDACKQTKDLRVVVILLNAATRTQGWPGFTASLTFLDGLLERFWADVHPQLDPDEPDDFTMRVNVIASLADAASTLTYLREAPLVQSVMGRFSLRDILVAEGEASHPADSEESPPDRQLIDAAIRAADAEALEQTNTAVTDAVATLGALESRLMSLVGAASAPDLSPLSALLARARKALAEGLALRPDIAGESAPESTGDTAAQATETAAHPQRGAPIARPIAGPIAGPDDVRRALEEICSYYRKHEPSSPIPILLERALRLISQDFESLIKDLAPDGLTAIQRLRGPTADDGDNSTGGGSAGTGGSKSSGW
ncbi:MAG: type VI secretion system protein TssA [Thiohalocapsa sp.]|jgi:type VI secretion system protein ImpA|uniref:type VI secretion system protein TssA n=1 Tax=Thiohalocapsa sp. TaxID=2497641 RepID=UPI0025EDB362|nr:type VI secretion system protein TssA [Thiohalocapsa sp.]MCG6942505.1 type VI secretion system protein TssA [Thiohalocapsa sp.]